MVVQTHLKSISGKGKGELVKGRNVTPPLQRELPKCPLKL
jgi:hypothetical protein